VKNERPALDVNSLFTLALGMVSPWEVVGLNLDAKEKRPDIKVDFAPGSTLPCPECGRHSLARPRTKCTLAPLSTCRRPPVGNCVQWIPADQQTLIHS
jgi:hypothetical protein